MFFTEIFRNIRKLAKIKCKNECRIRPAVTIKKKKWLSAFCKNCGHFKNNSSARYFEIIFIQSVKKTLWRGVTLFSLEPTGRQIIISLYQRYWKRKYSLILSL